MTVNRTLKLDDSARNGLRAFQVRLTPVIGRYPENSETIQILLRIANEHFAESEALIKSEYEDKS